MCYRENIYNTQNEKQISFVLNTESFTIAAGFVCYYWFIISSKQLNIFCLKNKLRIQTEF